MISPHRADTAKFGEKVVLRNFILYVIAENRTKMRLRPPMGWRKRSLCLGALRGHARARAAGEVETAASAIFFDVVQGPGSAEGGLKTGIFIESPRGARGNPPKHKGDRGDAF